ncbi:MAG TPA: class I SAM-dependent methyltransferase [Chromatiales bacterium]|nr:class I SAM-dependent methyltransferase [Chromatiales bacterium]
MESPISHPGPYNDPMTGCCSLHARSTGRCFSRFARRYRRRFERRGFEVSQCQLVAGLEQAGIRDATLLEIGAGVGYLHQTLLERGAGSAMGVDLALEMVVQSEDRARARGLAARTRYLCGDFLELADAVPEAEVTILDKVICCYPDADGLVRASLARTRRVYALTYPRDRGFVRFGVAAAALALRLVRSDFRPYVHDPVRIEQWITGAGFVKRYEDCTPVWLTQVFDRAVPTVAG